MKSPTKPFTQQEYFKLIAFTAYDFSNSEEYKKAVDILYDCWKNKGIVYAMGCGGSASTASHFVADLSKTANVADKPRFKAMALVDNIPLVSAWTNDNGWGTVFSEQLDAWLTPNDVLVGFSVHGGSGEGDAGPWSQNLVSAMTLAKKRGAKIIGFSGFDGGAMNKMADTCIVVPIDFEPYGTPAIEGMHVVIHHGIIFSLKERIKNGT